MGNRRSFFQIAAAAIAGLFTAKAVSASTTESHHRDKKGCFKDCREGVVCPECGSSLYAPSAWSSWVGANVGMATCHSCLTNVVVLRVREDIYVGEVKWRSLAGRETDESMQRVALEGERAPIEVVRRGFDHHLLRSRDHNLAGSNWFSKRLHTKLQWYW